MRTAHCARVWWRRSSTCTPVAKHVPWRAAMPAKPCPATRGLSRSPISPTDGGQLRGSVALPCRLCGLAMQPQGLWLRRCRLRCDLRRFGTHHRSAHAHVPPHVQGQCVGVHYACTLCHSVAAATRHSGRAALSRASRCHPHRVRCSSNARTAHGAIRGASRPSRPVVPRPPWQGRHPCCPGRRHRLAGRWHRGRCRELGAGVQPAANLRCPITRPAPLASPDLDHTAEGGRSTTHRGLVLQLEGAVLDGC